MPAAALRSLALRVIAARATWPKCSPPRSQDHPEDVHDPGRRSGLARRDPARSAPRAGPCVESNPPWPRRLRSGFGQARAGVVRTRSGERYKPSALRAYEGALKGKLLPELGNLRALTRPCVQDVLAEGHSTSTVRNAVLPLRRERCRPVALTAPRSQLGTGVTPPEQWDDAVDDHRGQLARVKVALERQAAPHGPAARGRLAVGRGSSARRARPRRDPPPRGGQAVRGGGRRRIRPCYGHGLRLPRLAARDVGGGLLRPRTNMGR